MLDSEELNRRRLIVVFSLAIFCLWSVSVQAKYSGGTGEPNNPYLIYTAEHLIEMSAEPEDWDTHLKLMADIDLSDFPCYSALIAPDTDGIMSGFQGIPFTGVFDGNGHTIFHLTIDGTSYLGLFGQLGSGGMISNLGLEAVVINGKSDYIGGLAGESKGFTTMSYCTGKVNGSSNIGGLVGSNRGSISTSYSSGDVGGDDYLGGLVGSNGGSIICCYSVGFINGSQINVGGLLGTNNITYATRRGVSTQQGTVINCFWDTQISGQTTSAAGTGLNTIQMQDINTYLEAGWDWVGEVGNGTHEVWQMPPHVGYPVLAIHNGYTPPLLPGQGTRDDPYLISTAVELGAILHYEQEACYKLIQDIDLSGMTWSFPVIPNLRGVLDGNDFSINHLALIGNGQSPCGLIGAICDVAQVMDLRIVDANVVGSFSTGILAGLNNGSLTNCHTSGTVGGEHSVGGIAGYNKSGALFYCSSNSEVNGKISVGGIAGTNTDGTVTGCHSTCGINGEENVGGLAGYNDEGTISGCNSNCIVSGEKGVGGLIGGDNDSTVTHSSSISEVSGIKCVGGLIGRKGQGEVNTSYSMGLVTGIEFIGGLMGAAANGEIADCYSTCHVSGIKSVGGLLGQITTPASAMWPGPKPRIRIIQCYATGTVSGNENVGGLLGSGQPNLVTESFWDVEASMCSISSGGLGRTTAEMQTIRTFLGWGGCDNESVWTIDEGNDYPRLSWENQSGVPIVGQLSDLLTGTGTEVDPYLIYTPSDLILIGQFSCDWDKHFKLMADIELDGSRGTNFSIIGRQEVNSRPFTGFFGGDGHTISNWTYDCNQGDNVGLFGYFTGREIANLGLINPNICSGTFTGALVGYLDMGVVTACCVRGGSVEGDRCVGGLVGQNCGIINNCYSTTKTSGQAIIGGLVGRNGATSYRLTRGGFKTTPNPGEIDKCYAAGFVSGKSDTGGLVGGIMAGTIESSFWDIETSGQVTSPGGGNGKTTAEMHTSSTFLSGVHRTLGWDFIDETNNGTEDIWWILEGQDYPRLWWELIPENQKFNMSK